MMGLSSHLGGDDHNDLVCLAKVLLADSLECIVRPANTTSANKKKYQSPDLAAYRAVECRNIRYTALFTFSALRRLTTIPIAIHVVLLCLEFFFHWVLSYKFHGDALVIIFFSTVSRVFESLGESAIQSVSVN
jgi:hypothetical protein